MVVEAKVEIPKEKFFHLEEAKWGLVFIQVIGSCVPIEIFWTCNFFLKRTGRTYRGFFKALMKQK